MAEDLLVVKDGGLVIKVIRIRGRNGSTRMWLESAKDRAQAEHDYQVNLKAELEVRLLHEKLDHLILHQWQRLLETQRLQAEMLDGIAERLDTESGAKTSA